MPTTILLIILILALFGAVPAWNYSPHLGGGVGLVVVILLILLLLGRI